MVFTSYEFLVFIAVLFVLYYLLPGKVQWLLLLGFSVFFYALADVRYLIYISVTIVSTYSITCRIDKLSEKSKAYLTLHKGKMTREEKKLYKAQNKGKQFYWLVLCLILNFGMLAVMKYADFGISQINSMLHLMGVQGLRQYTDIILPLGISFYTFQTMGYAIDVYRGQYPAERNVLKLALFVSFFPQLIQGPISRFGDLSQSLFAAHRFDGKQVSYGLQRILWGYFKKLVIADRIMIAVVTLIGDPDRYQGSLCLVGMIFYAVELYADFTGGIDITIGIAQVLGITVKENFRRPYFSKNIKEYWNRWHISLGSWFKEYVFYPVSVCKPMLKFSKFARTHMGEAIGKRMPVYLASILVWSLTGIWHGAGWNYLVWGLGNCFFIMISQELHAFYSWFHNRCHVGHTLWFKVLQIIRTILLMSSLRMFDCYRDVPLTFRMFGSIFTKWNVFSLLEGTLLQLGLGVVDYVILLMGGGLVFMVSMLQRTGSVREKIQKRPFVVRFLIWYGLFLTVLLTGIYGIGYDASQFIYNQF